MQRWPLRLISQPLKPSLCLQRGSIRAAATNESLVVGSTASVAATDEDVGSEGLATTEDDSRTPSYGKRPKSKATKAKTLRKESVKSKSSMTKTAGSESPRSDGKRGPGRSDSPATEKPGSETTAGSKEASEPSTVTTTDSEGLKSEPLEGKGSKGNATTSKAAGNRDSKHPVPVKPAKPRPRISIDQLDFFRPKPTRSRGAGSEQSRSGAREALYQLAVRRLDAHFSKDALLGVVQELKLAGHLAKKMRRTELVDVIVTDHWGIQPPEGSRESEAYLTTKGAVGQRKKRMLRSLELPEIRLAPDLLLHIQNATGGYIAINHKEKPKKVHYAPGQVADTQLEQQLLLALNESRQAVRRKSMTLFRQRGKSMLGHVPMAHRRPFPWMWARPRFVTRIRQIRQDLALTATENLSADAFAASEHPTQTMAEISASLPGQHEQDLLSAADRGGEIEISKEEEDQRSAANRSTKHFEGITTALPVDAAEQVLKSIRRAIPAYGKQSEDLKDAAWVFSISAGYLCHLPQSQANLATYHFLQPSLNLLDQPSELRPHFLSDVPPIRLWPKDAEMRRMDRQVTYILTRLGGDTTDQELPLKPFVLKLLWNDLTRSVTHTLHEVCEIDVFLPQCAMDARISLSKQIRLDLDHENQSWLRALIRACEQQLGPPHPGNISADNHQSGLPRLVTSPDTPIDSRAGLWALEGDYMIRGTALTAPKSPTTTILHADGSDGSRTSRYEISTAEMLTKTSLTTILRKFETDTNDTISTDDEASIVT